MNWLVIFYKLANEPIFRWQKGFWYGMKCKIVLQCCCLTFLSLLVVGEGFKGADNTRYPNIHWDKKNLIRSAISSNLSAVDIVLFWYSTLQLFSSASRYQKKSKNILKTVLKTTSFPKVKYVSISQVSYQQVKLEHLNIWLLPKLKTMGEEYM